MSYTALDMFEPVFVWNTLAKTSYAQKTVSLIKDLEAAAEARETRLAEKRMEIKGLTIKELDDGIEEMRSEIDVNFLRVEVQQEIIEWLQCYEERYIELMFPSSKEAVAVWK